MAIPRLLAVRNIMPETYGLATVDEQAATGTALYSVEGPSRVCFTIAAGAQFPLHASAPGQAFIAALPEARRTALIGRLSFKRFTPATLTDRVSFETRLASVRQRGFAIDLSEETEGCHCGGVAVLGPDRTPAAALWVTGMSKRLPMDVLIACIRTLQGAGRLLEQDLRHAVGRSAIGGGIHAATVTEAKLRLAENLAEPPVYPTLAKLLGVSYSTLRAAFHAETGATLGQWRLHLRLEEACLLLAETSLSIVEIAERTGFGDAKHFSVQFKHRMGVPPSQYRMSHPKHARAER